MDKEESEFVSECLSERRDMKQNKKHEFKQVLTVVSRMAPEPVLLKENDNEKLVSKM